MVVAVAAISLGVLTFTPEIAPKQFIQHTSMTMSNVPMGMLSEHAEYVIVGKILDITPVVYIAPHLAIMKENNKNPDVTIHEKEILSDIKIKVEEDLFGKYNGTTITVRIPGGEIPSQKTINDHSPTFVTGERVIVFVANGQSYHISPDNYTVIGLDQGTVHLGDKVISKFADNTTTEKQIKNKIISSKSEG